MTHELGPGARALIERARGEERAPDARELQRIRNNVALGVASAGVLLGAGEAAAVASKTSILALLGMAAKGGLLGGAVAIAGYAVERVTSEPAPVQIVSQAAAHATAKALSPVDTAVAVAPPAPAPEASVAPPAPPFESRAKGAPLSAPETAAPSEGVRDAQGSAPPSVGAMPVSAELLAEVQNLRRIQEHLRAGHGVEALRLLDASSDLLGRGQLRQERLAAEVLAACQSGQVDRARHAARRLLEENPATPSAARLKTSCVGGELDLP